MPAARRCKTAGKFECGYYGKIPELTANSSGQDKPQKRKLLISGNFGGSLELAYCHGDFCVIFLMRAVPKLQFLEQNQWRDLRWKMQRADSVGKD
jgi:hypothetical protein